MGVNEYYTSKKCPTCNDFVAQTDSIRRLYCQFHCKKYMHRDIMAAHNLCYAMRGPLEKQERPDYLQPTDANGIPLWSRPDMAQVQGVARGRKRRVEEEEDVDGRVMKKDRFMAD